MRYRVVAVGRVKDAALRAACDGYLARLSHYAKVDEIEVKDEARLDGGIPAGSRLVALSRQGEGWSSRELASRTERWEREARDVTFVVGGADALPADLVARADDCWSLSPLTLPHELARVVLYEQLYRAYSIRRGEPYHRGP